MSIDGRSSIYPRSAAGESERQSDVARQQELATKEAEIQRLKAMLEEAEKDKVGITGALVKKAGQTAGLLKAGVGTAAKLLHLSRKPVEHDIVLVEVTLYKGRGLVGLGKKKLSDPFAVVCLTRGGVKNEVLREKSATHTKTVEPVWEQRFSFATEPNAKLAFMLSVYSGDWSETFIGCAPMEVPDPEELTYQDDVRTVQLVPRASNASDAELFKRHNGFGSLRLAVRTSYTRGSTTEGLPTPGSIEIAIFGAQNLRPDDKRSTLTHAEIHVNGLQTPFPTRRTKSVKGTLDPIWEDRFVYPYAGVEALHVVVTVRDGNAGFLGEAVLNLPAEPTQQTIGWSKKKKVPLGPSASSDNDTLAKLTRKAKMGLAKAKLPDTTNHFLGGLGFVFVLVRASTENYVTAVRNDTDRGRPGGADELSSSDEDKGEEEEAEEDEEHHELGEERDLNLDPDPDLPPEEQPSIGSFRKTRRKPRAPTPPPLTPLLLQPRRTPPRPPLPTNIFDTLASPRGLGRLLDDVLI